MSKIIGIDLWTTNSCVAHMTAWKSEIIANAEWKRTTPSIVYIKGDEMLVGDLAKRKAILEPKNVVYEMKRFIWVKYSKVKKEVEAMPYDTKEGKDGGVLIVIDGKEYKPEQLSAFVLAKLKEDAEKYLWEKITRAVVTVPAYFDDSQRNATKAAWEIAWLTVERIINEPTAASLSYGEWAKKDEKIVVFDLWGGTFDVTVLDIGSEGTFQVLSTSGDTHLWWANFDEVLIDYILKEFKAKEWIDLSKNAMAMQRIKDEAENAKKQLSMTERVDITIPFITTAEDWTPRNLDMWLTRSQFENMCKELLERCKKPLLQAISDAKLDKSAINEVILVGWSTRMPSVKKIVADVFGRDPKATVNPDESVAAWAAIQWGIIQGDVTDILLLDVTPLSLAVEVEGWLAHVMIERNTTIPTKKANTYTTASDNQPAVTIHVTQWERQFSKDNKSLGQFNLEWIPPMKRGQAQIEVTFDIDANGILQVSAKEKSTGKEQTVKIEGATWISDEEITAAKAEAEKFAEDDKKKREVVETRNRLEAMIYSMEATMEEQKDKIPDEEKEKMKVLIAESQELKAKEEATKEELEAAIEKMTNEMQEIAKKYQAAPSDAGPNPADMVEDHTHDAPEWEVIDADDVADKK